MERLTDKYWRNFDPWECCGQDEYCKRGCHERGGCTNGCIVPKLYYRLAAYEDTGLEPEEIAHKNREDLNMTINEYQNNALRTANKSLDQLQQLENGIMGLNGEAGECIDILKKHLFQRHALDKEHIAKELGDVAWYLALSAKSIGYDLETIMQMNIDKLRARYPDGFDEDRSMNRKGNDI